MTGCSNPAPAPPTSTAATAPERDAGDSSGFEWMGGSRAERGGLAFAVPETDAVGVSMECDRSSRSVRISTVDDRIYAVANVPADDAALQSFRASGKMWVWDDNQFMRAEKLAERQAIEDFSRFCGAR